MATANSTEVGVLGTTEAGDAPMWGQWTMLDDARAELPLSATKEETFPVGLALDTGCTYRVQQDDSQLPVMPMVHLLSTHGYLISFNMLNLKQTYVDICSPPRPLPNQIKWQEIKFETPMVAKPLPPQVVSAPAQTPAKPAEFSFAVASHATSTPATASVDKPKSFFSPSVPTAQAPVHLFNQGANQPPPQKQPVSQSPFGTSTALGGGFGGAGTTTPSSSSFSIANLTKTTVVQSSNAPTTTLLPNPLALQYQQQQQQSATKPVPQTVSTEPTAKPLITVPPVYTKSQIPSEQQRQVDAKRIGPSPELIERLMKSEMDGFQKELFDLVSRTTKAIKTLEVGPAGELQQFSRQLIELEDIGRQATETTEALTSEVHSLRLGLNETFGMVAEARSKHEMFNDPEYIHLHDSASKSSTSQRQLVKLQSMIQTNQCQFNEINRQHWAHCSSFEDVRNKNNK